MGKMRRLLLSLLLFHSSLPSHLLITALDAYCGTDWDQASTDCSRPCPSGQDAECAVLLHPDDSNYCFLYTGCAAKVARVRSSRNNTNAANATAPKTTFRPTASPTPDPYLSSIKTATRKELNDNSDGTVSSYGYIFNMRTTPNSPVIQILSFDFMTFSTSPLDFELYTTPSTYQNFKGNYGRWVLLGKGTVQGGGMGSLTSIPPELITPVPIDGMGGVRAFYLTLDTKDMIYRVGGGSVVDEVVQQSSEELEIYEGESVQAFPFPGAEESAAYVGPSQFVGTVHYDTLPCRPLEAYGVLYTMPCPIIPTISPVPTSMAPTTMSPTVSRAPTMKPTLELTPEPSYLPTTNSPTTSPPPTATPTAAPVKAMESKVNVVVTIRNTPDRNLTAEEEKEFTNKLIGFFDIQADDVSVEDIEVWHQQKVDWVEDGGRNLQQMVSTAITLIFTISHYGDSSVSEIGNKLVNLMEENEGELVLLLRGSEHDFFLEADAIQPMVIDKLTASPVAAPKSATQTDASEIQSDESTDESPIGGYVGTGVGLFAFCSVIIGLSYFIMKKRHEANTKAEAQSASANSEDIETGSRLRSSKGSDAVAKFVPAVASESGSDGGDDASSSSYSSSSGSNKLTNDFSGKSGKLSKASLKDVSERSGKSNASAKKVSDDHNSVEGSIKKKTKPPADLTSSMIAKIINNNQTEENDSSSSSSSSSGSSSGSNRSPTLDKDKVRKASRKSTKEKKTNKAESVPLISSQTKRLSQDKLHSSTRNFQRMQSERKPSSKPLDHEYKNSLNNSFSEPARHRSRSQDRVDLTEGADRSSMRHLNRSQSFRSVSKDRGAERGARHLSRSQSLRSMSKDRGADKHKRRTSRHLIEKDKQQITDELNKLKTSDGVKSLRHSSRNSSSNELRKSQLNTADDLNKLKSSGGSDSVRLSSRNSSNDLRKSQLSSADDRVKTKRKKRKSKRDDLKESNTSGGSDGKLKRRSTEDENLRASVSSTDNLRRSSRDLSTSGGSKRKMSDSKKPMRRRTTIN